MRFALAVNEHQIIVCEIIKKAFRNFFTPNLSTDVHNSQTPWSWVLLEKPPVAELTRNFQKVYGIWRFITMLTRCRHWSQS
jgi:hypothetical protein